MDLLEALTLEDLTAVADYASRLPNAAPEAIASVRPGSVNRRESRSLRRSPG
jgi:hypothetical protein